MKKKITFLLMIFALLGGMNFNVLNAQETITIGSGSTTDAYLPTSTYYNYSMTQQIYTADEINSGAGFITHIAIRPATSNMSRNIIIYMENIDETAIPTTSGSMTYIVNDKPLYQGFTNFGNSGEWKTIELTTPFEYDGRNILLCISDITGSYYNGNQYFHTDETSVYSSVTKYRDGAKYDPTTEQYTIVETSYYGGTTYYAKKERNQIQFTITPASANVEVSAESIALGDVRLGNYWTEKNASANVEIKATATTITSISCNNNFFTLNYDLNQNPVALNVSYNKEANVSGAQSGNITISSADCEPVVIPVTATAYNPANGDVYENPITVNFDANNSFTAQATGMYDDYILPGEAEDGNAGDAVYKFTLANDAVVTANVNGTNAIAAIYKAEDLQGNGPSSDNNYEGVQSGPTGPTTFFFNFDDHGIEEFTLLDKNNDGRNWAIESNKIDKNSICSYSYIQTGSQNITPDNYFYTNDSYAITANSKLTYKVLSTWSEYYAIVIFENGVETTVQEGIIQTSGTETKDVDLSAYAGKSVQIGFRHFNCTGQYYIAIDDLALTDGSAKSRAGEAQIDGVQYPAGTYYLVAAAEGDFTLNLSTGSIPAPEQFAYTAPENNTIVEETNPELSWESAKYATSYDVYLGTTKVAEDITATSFQTTGLSNNTKYNWQVVAKNSIGEFKGEVYSFITPLDIPQNVTASSNEIYPNANNVTITWDAITGVKGYNVYVKANGEGSGIKHNGNELVTATSYELSNMDYSQNGHVVYVTAVYEIEGETYESNSSAAQTIKVTEFSEVSFVVTEGSNAVAGVKIVAVGTDEFGKTAEYTFYTKENGECTENILIGTYSITASKPDYKTNTIELTVNYGENVSFIALESNPSAPFAVSAEEGLVSWDAEYASYNVYRRDSEGLVKSLATEVKAEEYQDAEWETLADGEYEYGVSAMMVETNNITESFNTYSIPEGWTQNGTYTWNFNGATAYLYVYTSTSLQSNLTSPMIDLTGIASPKVTFKYCTYSQYGSSYSNTITVSVAESLDGAWTQIWSNNKKFTGYNTYENAEADLSNYSGKKVYVKFSSNINYCYSYIDDVVLPNATSSESKINWSAPVEKGGITFTGEGNWNTADNWNTVPTSTDKVTINGNATITEDVTVGSIKIASGATLTVKKGVVLNVTNGISNTNAAALVMEDGAQIIQTNSNVAATFNMNIVNPQNGWGAEQKDGWQFIASPLLNAKTSAFETSGENNDFDLYKYDGTKEGAEWVNYKDHQLEGDTFFYDFSNGMQGWTTINANADSYTWGHTEDGTGKNFSYGAPNGYNGEKGCLFSDAVWYNSSWQAQYINPNDYVVSPERVMIVKDSKLSFYIQSATYNYSSGEITVLVSESENASADSFVQIHSVNYSDKEWLPVTISLAEYAGKEVWIAIRHKINSAYNSYILIDNLELTDGKTRSRSKELFEDAFVNGRGYLASYETLTTATLSGYLYNKDNFDFTEVTYTEGKELANFHLLGNPFSFDMDWSKITVENVYEAFATVDSTGGYIQRINGTIPVGDGFFVKAKGENPSISYNAGSKSRGENVEYINVVASGKQGSNNVIIKLSGKEEKGFSKLENLNQSIADIYVKNNGRQYSVLGYDNDVKEVELFFDAKEMGNYTIGIEPNGKFQSVTLVDRMTGAETNMLLDSYTFTATANDNPNRFLIRLDNGQSATDGNFVYQSGEELIVDAEGTIQIIDVMGRMVYSNDVESSNNRINVSNLKGATYIVRNISNNTVRTQKIVIL